MKPSVSKCSNNCTLSHTFSKKLKESQLESIYQEKARLVK
jgi:hypothetical protein